MNWLKFHWKTLFGKEQVYKDQEDERDYEIPTGSSAYPSFSREITKTPLNQGKFNNCTNYALASIMEDLRDFPRNFLSRFYLWTKARIKEGRFPKNEGVYSRTVMDILNKQGIMFNNNKETIDYMPTPLDDLTARSIRGNSVQYFRGRNIEDIKRGIIDPNMKVYVALKVTNEIARYTGGIIDKIKNPNYGFGHALHCIGYSDNNNYLFIKNSWGIGWGENGNFRISYDSFDSIVYDIWLVKIKHL